MNQRVFVLKTNKLGGENGIGEKKHHGKMTPPLLLDRDLLSS
jgi:hypothetical protein